MVKETQDFGPRGGRTRRPQVLASHAKPACRINDNLNPVLERVIETHLTDLPSGHTHVGRDFTRRLQASLSHKARTHHGHMSRSCTGQWGGKAKYCLPFHAFLCPRFFYRQVYTRQSTLQHTASMACFGCGRWKCILSRPHLLLTALLSCRRWTWAIGSTTRLSKRKPSDWI